MDKVTEILKFIGAREAELLLKSQTVIAEYEFNHETGAAGHKQNKLLRRAYFYYSKAEDLKNLRLSIQNKFGGENDGEN